MSIQHVVRTYLRKTTFYPELVESIGERDSLFVSGILDSLGLLQLVAFLEKRLLFHIPPEDVIAEHFSTIEKITRYILLHHQGVTIDEQ